MNKDESKTMLEQPTQQQITEKKPDEKGGFHVEGHIKIFDPETNEVLIDKRNAIHYENMSVAMAQSLSNQNSATNNDPLRNKMEIRHITGATYTDIVVSCLLDYGEPSSQEAFDNSVDMAGEFVFDELGLKAAGTDKLLTHVIFHPVQKSLNRLIQIDYTIRIQSLTGFTEVQ